MKAKPFIGITGVASEKEADWLLDSCFLKGSLDSHTVNLGILISRQTFTGEHAKACRYPDIDTAYSLLRRLFSSFRMVIHYNSRSNMPLHEQIMEIFKKDNIYSDAVCRCTQLNIRQPELLEVEKIKANLPDLDIIMQLPLWDPRYSSPDAVYDFIDRYSAFVSYFILDPSGGRGASISDANLNLFMHLVEKRVPLNRLVFAGGLSGDNVSSVVSGLRERLGANCFSIDAEGRLRGGKCGGRPIGDWLNPDKVRTYLFDAVAVLT